MVNLCDLGLGNGFLDNTPKIQATQVGIQTAPKLKLVARKSEKKN